MKTLINLVHVEWMKAIRSRIPVWTSVFAAVLPMVIALMVLISRNPEISRKLGVISAKADLIAFSATDWPAFLVIVAQILSTAGFFMFIVIISWIFGREFADGTAKDLLAVPVRRSTILLAKMILFGIWSTIMALIMVCTSLLAGNLIHLPDVSSAVMQQGIILILLTTCLVILAVVPFAWLASLGRGYLLPLSLAVFTLIMANVAIALGWGDLFPWSIPGLFSQNKGLVGSAGFIVLICTGLIGWSASDLWWKTADQNR